MRRVGEDEGARGQEASLGEKADLPQKKIALPLYGVIALAALRPLTLAALFLR